MNSTLISTNTTELTTGEAAFLGGFIGSIAIFGIIFVVLVIIGEWKIFEKAGEKGWKCLIPIYGQYILFKILGMKTWFWVFLCTTIVASIMMSVNTPPIDYNASQEVINAQVNAIDWSEHVPYIVGMVITIIAGLLVDIVVSIRMAKAFGKGLAYILGLIFFPEIVLIVLGFGKAKYSAKNLK